MSSVSTKVDATYAYHDITVYHCISLYITVYHCISLCIMLISFWHGAYGPFPYAKQCAHCQGILQLASSGAMFQPRERQFYGTGQLGFATSSGCGPNDGSEMEI